MPHYVLTHTHTHTAADSIGALKDRAKKLLEGEVAWLDSVSRAHVCMYLYVYVCK